MGADEPGLRLRVVLAEGLRFLSPVPLNSEVSSRLASSRAYRVGRIVMPVAWALLIFGLSSVPAQDFEGAPLQGFPGVSFVVHGGLFFMLAVFALLALCRGSGSVRGWHAAAVMAVAVGYGLLDEYHQTFVAGRSAHGLDLLADALGAACAIVAGYAVHRLYLRHSERRQDHGAAARD